MESADSRKRNIERRRETSRYAARDRRGKEADIFSDLKEVVPIVDEGAVTHLDRIALLRVAATVCRLRKTAGNVVEAASFLKQAVGDVNVWVEDTLTESLDGFLLVVDSDGAILYVSESVALYLGLTQTDLTGRSIKDFLHPADYDSFVTLSAAFNGERDAENAETDTVLRMKTVISPRGRNLNLKSAVFKPVSFLIRGRRSHGGHVMMMQGVTIPAGQGSFNATATAVTKFSDTVTGTFMTRHTCDMRISYMSERLNYLLKNELKSLLGTSFYDLVHPVDCEILTKSMKELFAKGHVRTPYYRLIAAGGKLAWVMTEASTVSHTTKGQKGQYVICLHYMLGVQQESESLVISTDAAPAGLAVHVKTEIDDTKDYVGRQPEIMDCVDFTPLLGEGTFDDLTNAVLSTETSTFDSPAPVRDGSRKKSYDEVLEWLFRDQPSSAAPTFRQQREEVVTRQAPLASRNDLARPTGPIALGNNCTRGDEQNQGNCPSDAFVFSPLAAGFSQCRLGGSVSETAGSAEQRQRAQSIGSMARRDASAQSRSVSALPSPDAVPLCSAGFDGPKDVFPVVPPPTPAPGQATVSASSAANGSTNEGKGLPLRANDMMNSYHPIPTEDFNLEFEEPDLSCLISRAPFVSNDEMVQMSDSLPKELQFLFEDLPDWTPAEPLRSAAVTVQQPQYSLQSGNDFTSYEPAAKKRATDSQNYPPMYGYSSAVPFWATQQQTTSQQPQQQTTPFSQFNNQPRWS